MIRIAIRPCLSQYTFWWQYPSLVFTSQGIPCAQKVPESFSQGIQTSPVMEASPVQDVYGSPSCKQDLTQHRAEGKGPF